MDNVELDKIFSDKEVAIFFATWIKNGMNGAKAYKELHPETTDGSARVLASRLLAKVNISDILAVFGLGIEEYFSTLKEGLNCSDFKTRRPYHEVLGKLLGIKKDSSKKEPVDNNQYFFKSPQELVEAMRKNRETRLAKEAQQETLSTKQIT